MYNYWKDVRRIEVVSNFPDVEGGLAIIITNDKVYWDNIPNATSGHLPFSTYEGNMIGGNLSWGKTIGANVKGSHTDFRLDGNYPCHWKDTNITATAVKDKSPFKYMISTVTSDNE